MLRMSNRNRKKSSKSNLGSTSKNNTKKSEYVEEVNEIILNDLVPEERKSEFGIEEVPQKTPKKKGGLNFGLNLNKKKSSSNSAPSKGSKANSSKKENNKEVHNDNESDNNVVSESSNTSSKGKKSSSSKNKSSKKEKTSPKKEKTSSKKEDTSSNSDKSSSKKKKTSSSTESSSPNSKKKGKSKSQSIDNEEPVDNSSHIEDKTTHKNSGAKKSTGIKKKRVHDESLDTSSPLREVESYIPVDFNIKEDDNKSVFRSEEHSSNDNYIEVDVEHDDICNKFENLVWSEDKFPKK